MFVSFDGLTVLSYQIGFGGAYVCHAWLPVGLWLKQIDSVTGSVIFEHA